MKVNIVFIKTLLWIGLGIFFLITVVIRRAQVRNWNNGSSFGLPGATPFRTQTVANKDLFYEMAIAILFKVDMVLLALAIYTTITI
jgi:hypothetical protein